LKDKNSVLEIVDQIKKGGWSLVTGEKFWGSYFPLSTLSFYAELVSVSFRRYRNYFKYTETSSA
jgi:hypothetical protein